MANDVKKPTEEQVAFTALTNLVRLLAAELVAGEHRHDVIELIRAIDDKLDKTPLPNSVDQQTARNGIRRAKAMLGRGVYGQIRRQAEEARLADAKKPSANAEQRRVLN